MRQRDLSSNETKQRGQDEMVLEWRDPSGDGEERGLQAVVRQPNTGQLKESVATKAVVVEAKNARQAGRAGEKSVIRLA